MKMFTKKKLTGCNVQSSKGFTLIEVMIVAAILAILVAIAVPSYKIFVTKASRTEATSFLLEAAGEQQRFYTENNRYASAMTEMGYGSDQIETETGLYTVSVTASSPSSFTLTAAPLASGSQATDTDCGSFTINSGGLKGIVGGTGTAADCW